MSQKEFRVWQTGRKGTLGYRNPAASGGHYRNAKSKQKAINAVSREQKIPKSKLQAKLWKKWDNKGKMTYVGWGKNPKKRKYTKRR
tara:strand:+ start:3228 stop:3485 length:258 start_codon:yes stop_codon:yes gene_type:complete